MENSQKTPLLSIITVVLNDRDGLAQTKLSIARQSFQDYEWIVVDGVSTDGTVAGDTEIEGVAVCFISQPDNGVYSGMNTGMQKAKGQFLLFLNAGDTFRDAFTLEKLAPFFSGDEFDFIYGNSIQWQGGRQLCKTSNGHQSLAYGMFACHQAMYFRRNAGGGIQYDERYTISADYDFTARYLKNNRKIKYVDDVLCVCSPPGLSMRFNKKGRHENWIIQNQTLGVGLIGRLLILTISNCMQLLSETYPQVYRWLQQNKNRFWLIRLGGLWLKR